MVPSAGPKKRYVTQTHGRTTAPSPAVSRYLKDMSMRIVETTNQMGAPQKSIHPKWRHKRRYDSDNDKKSQLDVFLA